MISNLIIRRRRAASAMFALKRSSILLHEEASLTRCICATSSSVVLDLQDIPTAKGVPFFGTVFAMLAKGGAEKLHEYVDFRHKQLGPIFREKVGPVTSVFLCDPKDMRAVFSSEGKYPVHLLPEAWTFYNETFNVERGIFFMDGEEWLQNRKILNKLLLKGNLDWIGSACDEVCEDLVNRWSVMADNGQIIPDLETQLYRWSIDVMLSVILGAKEYNSVKNDLNDIVNDLAANIYLIFKTSAKLQLVSARFASKLGLSSWRNFAKAMDRSLQLTNTLMTRLIDNDRNSDGLLSRLKNENVNRTDILRILADFIIAAGDTTAYTMEWLLYVVGSDKAVQKKVRSLQSTEEASSYLRSVVKESLRLYPVAPFITRILTQGVTVKGFNIPAGTLVVFSIYTSGRDPHVFENPQLFIPERWSRDSNNNNNLVSMQQSTLPFGFGSRSCIGKKVAEMQLQKTIGKIVHSFDMDVVNKDEIQMILKMVAVPSNHLRLRLIRL
ncbi:cytochrome P450 315a1, mitochondrial [Agrilus planipennis]|uniref:Cytochrome P450 315a1, mitochondrial n=1 Tax=Agrilus planipennis TaxID=224129 RepID=A0A7F5RAV3_AGRPL|nr:cytochrome P450 315a1, mitochondrial [Agrilus planipennis]